MNVATIRSVERDAAEPNMRAAESVAVKSGAPKFGGPGAAQAGGAATTLSGSIRGTGVMLPSSSSAAEGAAVLCNITDQSWLLHRTHGTFAVVGKTADEPFALTGVTGRSGTIDLGEKRTLEFPISAREIATDLAREINSDGGEGSYFGVFACAGNSPTETELREAREKLETFYRNLVAGADRQWERTHNVVLISDLERRAAKELHLEKEWCYEPQQRVDCPACGEKLKPGVAVCRVCGAVLDKEKAAKFGLGTVTQPAVFGGARPEPRRPETGRQDAGKFSGRT